MEKNNHPYNNLLFSNELTLISARLPTTTVARAFRNNPIDGRDARAGDITVYHHRAKEVV